MNTNTTTELDPYEIDQLAMRDAREEIMHLPGILSAAVYVPDDPRVDGGHSSLHVIVDYWPNASQEDKEELDRVLNARGLFRYDSSRCTLGTQRWYGFTTHPQLTGK